MKESLGLEVDRLKSVTQLKDDNRRPAASLPLRGEVAVFAGEPLEVHFLVRLSQMWFDLPFPEVEAIRFRYTPRFESDIDYYEPNRPMPQKFTQFVRSEIAPPASREWASVVPQFPQR